MGEDAAVGHCQWGWDVKFRGLVTTKYKANIVNTVWEFSEDQGSLYESPGHAFFER